MGPDNDTDIFEDVVLRSVWLPGKTGLSGSLTAQRIENTGYILMAVMYLKEFSS